MAQWRGGAVASASHARLREPGFESILCCLVKPWASVFTRYYSSSFSYINEYLAIDILLDGSLFTNSLRALIAVWLDASQGCRDSV